MSNTAYIGSGTTLSSKYYLRSFYRSNREAGTSSKRREFSGNQLALADGRALRQAVRRLTSSDFSDDQDANTRNSVLAYYPDHYNNMLSSAAVPRTVTLERSAKQLKNITSDTLPNSIRSASPSMMTAHSQAVQPYLRVRISPSSRNFFPLMRLTCSAPQHMPNGLQAAARRSLPLITTC